MNQKLWASDPTVASLSRERYGDELAKKVVERLIKDSDGGGLWFSHRDYCGHGLMSSAGHFYLIEVRDGYADCSDALIHWRDSEAFNSWLCAQSDYSLSGADESCPAILAKSNFMLNNQRINRKRLIDYATYGRQ